MKAYRSLLLVVGLGLLAASLTACQPVVVPLAAAPNADAPTIVATTVTLPTPTPTPEPPPPTAEPTPTTAPTPLPGFPIGNELTIAALLERSIEGSPITIEQHLENGANYARYIASYISEGNKIYGLLTVPFGDAPEGGHKAIVFIHGYIPPDQYRTTERYVAYVDALAQAGFVVFKIDLRGFGESEGEPTGAYFSPDYSIDAIAALKSLQTLDYVDPEGIGLWGHSMAGNVTLRAMLIEPAIQAGVIWAGAVYSYDDFTRYSIDDPSYSPTAPASSAGRRIGQLIRETYGPPNTAEPFWRAVSLTEHIDLLQAPIQLHHAVDDNVVTIDYSRDLAAVLNVAGKAYEFYEYAGGGHNITSPDFGEAMRRTIAFFQENL
jgi:dipeptidyl aminopeptidase/acylaminoacyl peptidase